MKCTILKLKTDFRVYNAFLYRPVLFYIIFYACNIAYDFIHGSFSYLKRYEVEVKTTKFNSDLYAKQIFVQIISLGKYSENIR